MRAGIPHLTFVAAVLALTATACSANDTGAAGGQTACTADEATRISNYVQKVYAAGEAAGQYFQEGQALQSSLSRSCYDFWDRVTKAAYSPGARRLPSFDGQKVQYDAAGDIYTAGDLSCTRSGCY